MSKTIRLDDETLGTMVNGKFVFAYDWVVGLPNAETNKVELYNFLSDKTKVDLMDIIKTDFLTYQELEDWGKLYNQLEKEYKELTK